MWRVRVLHSLISALLGVDRLNSGDLDCDKHQMPMPILCGIWGFIFQTVQICLTTQGKHSSRDVWDLNEKRKVPELFSNCCFGSEPPARASRAGRQSHSFWLLWLSSAILSPGYPNLHISKDSFTSNFSLPLAKPIPPPWAVDCSFV